MHEPNISLREWKLSDLDSLVRYADDFEVARNLRDRFPHPYTEADGREFLQLQASADPVTVFAIDLDGEAIGGIGIHPMDDIHRRNAELGYWLARPFWGKGIISKAIRMITDHVFTCFEIDRIFACPFGRNTASQRVLEKNGFVLEARFEGTLIKNGMIEDELHYAIRREDWKKAKL